MANPSLIKFQQRLRALQAEHIVPMARALQNFADAARQIRVDREKLIRSAVETYNDRMRRLQR